MQGEGGALPKKGLKEQVNHTSRSLTNGHLSGNIFVVVRCQTRLRNYRLTDNRHFYNVWPVPLPDNKTPGARLTDLLFSCIHIL